MTNSYNLLELFKGTGSVGKVAHRNFNIVSLDFEKKYKPDIQTDILDWDYKKFYEETHFLPDFIWASPPCNTFSVLSYKWKERNTKTAEPYSERAKEGTRILYRTLEIVDFFLRLNPNLLYIIENPRGMMRHDEKMKALPYRTMTHYCHYGDDRRKPTDFWSNFPLQLNEKACPKGVYKKISMMGNIETKYYIPPLLIEALVAQTIERINQGKLEPE